METLAEAFPELSAEVVRSLRLMRHSVRAQLLPEAPIHRVTFDNQADAAYIYLCSADATHGTTIPPAPCKWFVVLDTTADNKPLGIEWLSPPGTIKGDFRRRAAV